MLSTAIEDAYVLVVTDLHGNNQLAEAETVVIRARSRFPANAAFVVLHAKLAVARSDFDNALTHWQEVRKLTPKAANAWLTPGALLLRELMRHDDADTLLSEGIMECPDDFRLACEHAWCAVLRRDLPAARKRYDAIRCRFPERP